MSVVKAERNLGTGGEKVDVSRRENRFIFGNILVGVEA